MNINYLLTLFFIVSKTTGVAMHTDEYVPTTIPISRAKAKPLITSPPKINVTNNTKNVVRDVLTVRLIVLLIDRKSVV